jgi:predicted  nucleic acid-binding Zn-ribbon protein
MREDLKTLCDLQETDDRLTVLARDRTSLKESLETIDSGVREAEAALEEMKAALEEKQKAYRGMENDLKECEETILKFKRQEFDVKTNEALAALKKEISQEEERKSNLEDEALLAMEDIETQVSRISEVEKDLERKQEEGRRDKDEVERKLEAIDEEEAATRREREQRRSLIPADLLMRYEKVRAHNRGVGVARLGSRTCSSCHCLITPQDIQLIKRNDQLKYCEGCGAVLVWTDGGGGPSGSQTQEGQ